MKISNDRILTTHVGSLPRPLDLFSMLEARESGGNYDPTNLKTRVSDAVKEIAKGQVESGIDIINDGEQSKISYTFYLRHRLAGVGALKGNAEVPRSAAHRDLMDHPEILERLRQGEISAEDAIREMEDLK